MPKDELRIHLKNGQVLRIDLSSVELLSLPRTIKDRDGKVKVKAVKVFLKATDYQKELNKAYRALKKDKRRYKALKIKWEEAARSTFDGF